MKCINQETFIVMQQIDVYVANSNCTYIWFWSIFKSSM